jgi:hypothetical protein
MRTSSSPRSYLRKRTQITLDHHLLQQCSVCDPAQLKLDEANPKYAGLALHNCTQLDEANPKYAGLAPHKCTHCRGWWKGQQHSHSQYMKNHQLFIKVSKISQPKEQTTKNHVHQSPQISLEPQRTMFIKVPRYLSSIRISSTNISMMTTYHDVFFFLLRVMYKFFLCCHEESWFDWLLASE